MLYELFKHHTQINLLCSVLIRHFELLRSLFLLDKNVYMNIYNSHQTTISERIIIQMYVYVARKIWLAILTSNNFHGM